MSLVELVLAAVVGAAAVFAALRLRLVAHDLDTIATVDQRLRAAAGERARVAKSADEIGEVVENTTAVVDLGTGVVKTTHTAIANIPFDVLDAIPATRAGSKIARSIHDGIASGVYGAIGEANKAIGEAFRRDKTG